MPCCFSAMRFNMMQNYCNMGKSRGFFMEVWLGIEYAVKNLRFSVDGVYNKKLPHHGGNSIPRHAAAKCYVALSRCALVGHFEHRIVSRYRIA